MTTTSTDKLLDEIERQRKYLAQLPEGYDFPLFNVRRALESQRRSGYRDTAAAAREIVDNAVEAGAKHVHVVFDQAKGARKRIVKSIAFIDDGSGMLPEMTRFALSWGGGTHFDDPDFIAKFGFGLPNSSINQGRRAEVYTRLDATDPIVCGLLDIDLYAQHGLQSIPEPEEAELPLFVQDYMDRNGLSLDHGAVIVWTNLDRITYKTPGALKDHLVDDFGVTYRYMLAPTGTEPQQGKFELIVEGVRVEPIDPLFLEPYGRYYVPPEEGGAIKIEERSLAVSHFQDPETGERHLRWLQDPEELERSDEGATIGTIYVRIGRLPVHFATPKTAGGERTDANRRWDIRKTRRGMSFVRSGRELQTVDAFPRSPHDRSSGLGSWPLLQSYAYYWGVEVQFGPELDEVFGLTNDKQGVRPLEDFWRILHEAGVDAALNRENAWQREKREREVAQPKPSEGPSAAEHSAQLADAAIGRVLRQVPDHKLEGAREQLEKEAEERAARTGVAKEEARKALEEEAKRKPYRIDYVDMPHGPFYEPVWGGPQIVVRINTHHQFYGVLYQDLLRLPGGSRAKEAVDILLIALSKAELTAEDEQVTLFYEGQRKEVWSPFLASAMKALAQHLPRSEDEVVATSDEVAEAS